MKYLHIMNSKRTLGITIAMDRTENNNGTFLFSCATAFCAPTEKNFSRPKGRLVAEQRFNFDESLNSHKKFSIVSGRNDYREAILNHLYNSVPMEWARGLLKKELGKYEQRKNEAK